MGALASYFPTMEEASEDFLNAGLLVEDRVASERADNDVEELQGIHATLEALALSMEATLEADPWTPVFVGHALDAIGRRTGLRMPTVSLEDATVSISMEGLGGVIKNVWDAIVKAVRAAMKAVADFFRRIFELVTGKKQKIESNFEKAKKAGDVTPAKLIDTNKLAKVIEKDIEEFKKKLKQQELVKSRVEELVALTAAAASVIDRANVLEGNGPIPKETVTHQGVDVVVVRRDDVKKANYVKLCHASNDFISHASVAGIHLTALKDRRCLIDIHDLTELIWECLLRGKEAREAGAAISASVNEITDTSIAALKAYFAKDSKLSPGEFNFSPRSDQLNAQIMKSFEAVFNEFSKMRSQSGLIPTGRRVIKLQQGKNVYHLFAEGNFAPLLAKFTDHEIVMEIPTWSQSKKASDGVTSILIMNTQKTVVAKINNSFDQAIAKWDAAVKWVYEQGHADKGVQAAKYISDYCKYILTDTQNMYNRILRSQMALEGTVIQLADVLSGTLGRLADAKNLAEEFA